MKFCDNDFFVCILSNMGAIVGLAFVNLFSYTRWSGIGRGVSLIRKSETQKGVGDVIYADHASIGIKKEDGCSTVFQNTILIILIANQL